jgi:aminoglycoside phosphotransferase family enzyme/predicted kinase
MSGAQAEAIAFLTDPATHGGVAVERIDTHGAIVVLTPTRAFKLKRAVAFSYMDFSTVARRREMCRAELRLNRRTAPLLYEKVCAIRRGPDGALALVDEAVADAVDDGEVLDWVVVMRRFEPGSEFDRLAARGALDLDLVRRLAAIVARFHRGEPPVQGHGGAAGLRAVVAENRREFERQAGVLPATEAEALDRACLDALAPLATLLDRRAAEGRVRRCHGDLHLGNVCLHAGEPTLFDAIEFDESIACIDTLFDLAFLLMDLELRASRAHANAALNAYLEIVPETDGLAALPLLLALRAGIRAHTRAAAASAQQDAVRRAEMLADARRHLSRASRFLAPAPVRLLAVGGVSGTGKSTLARGLAPELHTAPGAVLLRTDVMRKELAGVAFEDRLGSSHYTPERAREVYAALFARAASILRAGRSVVLDAVFLRDDERARAAALARETGARFEGIWLELDPSLAAARIAGRQGDASDATPAVLEMQLAAKPQAVPGWRVIDSRGEPSQVLARARSAMSA